MVTWLLLVTIFLFPKNLATHGNHPLIRNLLYSSWLATTLPMMHAAAADRIRPADTDDVQTRSAVRTSDVASLCRTPLLISKVVGQMKSADQRLVAVDRLRINDQRHSPDPGATLRARFNGEPLAFPPTGGFLLRVAPQRGDGAAHSFRLRVARRLLPLATRPLSDVAGLAYHKWD